MLKRKSEPVDLAKERFDEAVKVRQAYDVVVARHRAAWRSAAPDVADRAKRRLRLALDQQAKAIEDERIAWLDHNG